MARVKDMLPGLMVTLMIAVISFLTSSLHASFDVLVISIIFGMLVSSILGDREIFEKGIDAALKVFLPIGIALYGLQLTIGTAEYRYWPMVALIVAVTFAATYLVSSALGIDKGVSVLLSAGMSICGASAIAVMAPLVGSKKEDTSVSLISIMTVGLTGMLIYKFLPQMVSIPVGKFAFLAGTTLPMIGQVKVAAARLGPEGYALALNLKLLRISFLIIIACIVLFISGRRKKHLFVPWFMLVFFFLAFAVNFSDRVAALRDTFEPVSRFSLATALSAVGLSIDIDSVPERGAKPILAAFISWGIVVSMLYLVLNLINV